MKIKRFNFNKIYIKYFDVIIEFGIKKMLVLGKVQQYFVLNCVVNVFWLIG